MQRQFARRIESLEQSILPLTASVFLERVRKHARRSGKNFDSAMQSLVSKASDDELQRLETEFERMAFGDDIAARDAVKREVLVAAGIQSGICRLMNRGMRDGKGIPRPEAEHRDLADRTAG
jgi:hypothetical protein